MKIITLEEFHEANGVAELAFEEVAYNTIVYAYKQFKFIAYTDENALTIFTPTMSSQALVRWSRIINEDAEERQS